MSFSDLKVIKFLAVITSLFAFNSLLAQEQNSVSLSLEKAMQMGEKHSFLAKMAKQDQFSVEAQNSGAIEKLLPTISISGEYLQNSPQVNALVGSQIGEELGSAYYDKTVIGTATLTQPLVDLTSLTLNVKNTAALARAALHTKNQSVADARYNGAYAFITAEQASQLLDVAQSALEVSKKQLSTGQAQFNEGQLTNADLLKFKLNYENAKASLAQAQTTYEVAMVTLRETIGVSDSENINLESSGDKSVWEAKEIKDLPQVNAIYGSSLLLRDDLLAAQENVEAAKYAKLGAMSSYLPSVSFVATYSRNFEAQDVNIFGTVYTKQQIQDTLSYGVQFTWVLLDWGVRQSQISSAVASEQKAKYALENLNYQARIDITKSTLQFKTAVQNLDSAKASLQYAQDEYAQMKARFDNGQITTTDLISAANDQTSAKANIANVRASLDLAWMAFKRSTGKYLTTENE